MDHSKKIGRLLGTVLYAVLLLTCFFGVLVGCHSTTPTATTASAATEQLPTLRTKVNASAGIDRAAVTSNHQVYFLGYDQLNMIDGPTLVGQIDLADSATGLSDIGVDPHTGLAYVTDQWADVVHVLSNTQLLTTITGIVESPLQVVTEEDSGELYIFYSRSGADGLEYRAAVLSGTQKVADIAIPLWTRVARYNPIDGRIYLGGAISPNPTDSLISPNAVAVIDNREVISTISPIDKPDLAAIDMAIDPTTGDVYILLISKVVYWDRHNPLRSIDLYALGYKNLGCITVDPTRGWAYVCSWPGRPSYMLVVDKDQFVGAIEVEHWPHTAVADATHDYIYVGHYDPTYLSIIRGTELITTLDYIGYGTANVVVDEERGYIYMANADDGTVTLFAFPAAPQPTLWQRFLPFIQR